LKKVNAGSVSGNLAATPATLALEKASRNSIVSR
jgi:hypothetical protein